MATHSAGVIADPNADNSVYGDDYSTYAGYDDGADTSYDESMMAVMASADANKGELSSSCYCHCQSIVQS